MTVTSKTLLLVSAASLAGSPALADDSLVIAPRLEVMGSPSAPLTSSSETVSLHPGSLEDLGSDFGNLHLSESGAGGFGSLTSLRGLSNTPYFGDPAVTVYLDDLPLGSGFATPASLFGYDQVELFRGSAGSFVTGRGGPGGTLLLRSRDQRTARQIHAEAAYGDRNQRAARVSGNWSRSHLSLGASLAWEAEDGTLLNTTTGKHVDSRDHRFLSANLRYRPTDATELSAQAVLSQARDGAQPLVPLGGSWHTVERSADGKLDADFSGFALRGTQVTDAGVLSSITSFTDWKMRPYENLLNIPIPFHSVLQQRQRAFNEELRLRSRDKADYPWSAGFWFSDARTEGSADRGVVFGQEIPYEASSFQNRSKTFAGFVETVLTMEDGWTLTGGLRAESVRKTTQRVERLAESGSWSGERSDHSIQPRVAATWKLDPRNLATLSWSLASKPGGFSAYTADKTLGSFRDERTQAFEGSWRSRTSASTVLTLRGFYYKISDYQVERSFSEADYIVVNAPHARSVGAELEGSVNLNPQLSLRLSAGLQKVVVLPYADPVSSTTASGNRKAPYAPASSVRAVLSYASGPFTLEVGGTRIGRTFFDERETALYSQDTYITAEALLRYRRNRWSAVLSGTNLFDKGYYTLIVPGIDHGTAGAPRTLTATVEFDW